jgi:hypothetical protein
MRITICLSKWDSRKISGYLSAAYTDKDAVPAVVGCLHPKSSTKILTHFLFQALNGRMAIPCNMVMYFFWTQRWCTVLPAQGTIRLLFFLTYTPSAKNLGYPYSLLVGKIRLGDGGHTSVPCCCSHECLETLE